MNGGHIQPLFLVRDLTMRTQKFYFKIFFSQDLLIFLILSSPCTSYLLSWSLHLKQINVDFGEDGSGYYDITNFKVSLLDDTHVVFDLKFRANHNPWSSEFGFCLQHIQIYVDINGVDGQGSSEMIENPQIVFTTR